MWISQMLEQQLQKQLHIRKYNNEYKFRDDYISISENNDNEEEIYHGNRNDKR